MSTVTGEARASGDQSQHEFRYVRADDPVAAPLLADLEREYDARYGIEVMGEAASVELNRYPVEAFAPPTGAFLVLLEDGEAISGGAFFKLDARTAEVKRVWTRGDRRGRGVARLVLTELEHEARRLGYERVYLTTGPRQPEAVALYLGHGYTPLYDPDLSAEEVGLHAFEKSLIDLAPASRAADVDLPSRPAHPSAAGPRDAHEVTPRKVVPRGPAAAADQRRARTVVPQKHWLRWVFSAVVVFLLAQLIWTLFTNPQWRWNVFAEHFFDPAVLRGLGLTLALTAAAAVIGFVLGAIVALARMSSSPLLTSFAWGYVWFFRSVPLVVQLVIWYNLGYLFPTVGFGTPFTYDFWLIEFDTTRLISAATAAILGLSLHQAAYSAEIIRGGLLSVDQGQLEAAAALGIPRGRRFFRIVLPQAARMIVPNASNEIISLLKGTSAVFVIALPELFYTVQVTYARNQQVIPLLLVAAVWYMIITTLLSISQYAIERRFARGSSRVLPPTPLARLRASAARISEGKFA